MLLVHLNSEHKERHWATVQTDCDSHMWRDTYIFLGKYENFNFAIFLAFFKGVQFKLKTLKLTNVPGTMHRELLQ